MLPNHDFIILNRKDSVQQQTNSYDCGLYSLAFLISLCDLLDPTSIKFDQSKMREHYISMNSTENITAFPKQQALQRPLRMKSNLKNNESSYVIQLKN